VILGAIFQPLAKAAERYPFEIIVTCVANPKCIFSDGDIELNIKIKNISSKTVGLNTHYIRRVGPYIKLTDLTTGKSIDLSVNLASPDLLQEYEQLRPGTSVEFNEKLLAYQIKNFGDQSVNLLVRVAFPGNFVVAQQAPKSFDKEAIIKITDTRNYGKVYIR
jgi:hypothetical protein